MCAKQVKKVTGEVPTTGHKWGGMRECDNPMSRWWVWRFYACIACSNWQVVAYPAWPLLDGATQEYLGYDTRQEVEAEIKRFDDANAEIKAKLVAADLGAIAKDDGLNQYATAAGAAVFRTWCAQCHLSLIHI